MQSIDKGDMTLCQFITKVGSLTFINLKPANRKVLLK